MTVPRNAPTELMRRAIDRLPSMVGYWDLSLRNVFSNKAYSEYFSIGSTPIPGMHIADLIGDALYQLNLPYISGALAGEMQQFDRTLIDAHGAVRAIQVTYVPDVLDGVVVGFTEMVVDIGARTEAERQRDRAVRLFQVAMENAPIGKAILTLDGRWVQVNKALCELLGYTAEELQQKTFRNITHPDDVEVADEHLASLTSGTEGSIASEKRYIRKDGTCIWVQRNATIVRDADAGDVIIAQIQDITARKAAETALERQLLIDDLTGLANRRRLMAELQTLKETDDGNPIGILFVDVDSFKSVNDRYGHAAGDRLLAAIGARIRANLRAGDIACRTGGDEFVALLRGARSAESVERLAARARTMLAGPYLIDGTSVPATVSVGWSWDKPVSPEKLLHMADERMYSSKRA